MGIVSLPSFGSDPATITASALDGKVDPLATEVNGALDNDNIKASAGIVYSKLTLTGSIVNADVSASAGIVDTKLATISTSQKVNLSAVVATSQATGDIVYASSATVLARLAIGTSSQVLIGGTIPAWATPPVPVGGQVQMVNTQVVTSTTSSTALPNDDTIPAITEGGEFMTLAITPTHASNKLKIEVVCNVANDSVEQLYAALFQDATSPALAAGASQNALGNVGAITFIHYMAAGTTSATTFRVRAGGASGTTTFNGAAGARKLGGVLASSITITEIKV